MSTIAVKTRFDFMFKPFHAKYYWIHESYRTAYRMRVVWALINPVLIYRRSNTEMTRHQRLKWFAKRLYRRTTIDEKTNNKNKKNYENKAQPRTSKSSIMICFTNCVYLYLYLHLWFVYVHMHCAYHTHTLESYTLNASHYGSLCLPRNNNNIFIMITWMSEKSWGSDSDNDNGCSHSRGTH